MTDTTCVNCDIDVMRARSESMGGLKLWLSEFGGPLKSSRSLYVASVSPGSEPKVAPPKIGSWKLRPLMASRMLPASSIAVVICVLTRFWIEQAANNRIDATIATPTMTIAIAVSISVKPGRRLRCGGGAMSLRGLAATVVITHDIGFGNLSVNCDNPAN